MDHVGPADERLQGLAGRRRLQVECQALLASLAGGEDPFDPAHLVPGRGLHLDDLRTEVGQQHGAERAGQEVAQVEDPQTAERSS